MAKKQKKVGIDQIHMQNAVKTLAANIRFASVDDPIRSIVVTSSVPNEGKTTVAISLAEAIASSGRSASSCSTAIPISLQGLWLMR